MGLWCLGSFRNDTRALTGDIFAAMIGSAATRTRLALVTAGLCLGACRQNPQDAPGAAATPDGLPYDRALARMAAADSFNGSVLVALPDTVFEQTYRAASAPEGMHTASNYRYPIGEVAQLLLRAAYFRLADRGRLNLNTAVGRYLPDLPQGDVVNFRMLLDHRGGLPGVLPQGVPVANVQYLSQPGTEEHYSALGYEMLAAALARITGTSPEEVIRVQVLEPAGMTNTGVLTTDDPPGVLAAGYSDITGALRPVPLAEFPETIARTDAAGALATFPEYYSTIADLFYLAQYMPESGFLRGELRQPGVRPGYRSYFYASLEPERTVVVLSNDEAVALPAVVGALERR